MEEAQAGIKIARRNINNLKYTDDSTLMAESKELKNLLMKVKEESEKVGLNSTFRKLRSWLQSPSAVILEPPTIKSVIVFIVSPSICHESWDQMS